MCVCIHRQKKKKKKQFKFGFFWPQHTKVPGPGIKPEPRQWRCQVLNLKATRELSELFFLVFFFRAVPAAYTSSQSRGQIGAAASGLCHSHSNARSKLPFDLHRGLQQCQILNPLSRDQTHVLMDTSRVRYR